MTISMRFTGPIAGIAALMTIVACSGDVTGGNRHDVQLSFTTNAGVSSAADRVAADLIVGESNELVIQKVQLVFGKLELDRQTTDDLKMLGVCINYNAYGETVADLRVAPQHLAREVLPFADPRDFIGNFGYVLHTRILRSP